MKTKLKSTLYPHQKENVQFHMKHPASADWSEPGIGKSLISLAKVAILKDLGLVKRVLIVCPKTVMLTWDIEIKKHTDLTHTRLLGSLDEKIRKLGTNSDIYSLTYDSLPGRSKKTEGKLFKELLKRRFDFLIGDEVTLIQNREASRTKAFTALSDAVPTKLFLSGTPITNNATSIFNIYRALDGGRTFGRNFFASRNKYFKNVGSYFPMWIPKELLQEEFSRKLYEIATRKTKDECLDLPEKVWSTRYTTLSEEQMQYYAPIAEGILKDFETLTGRVKIASVMDKIGKLSQITGGFLYTKEGLPFGFSNNSKLELLEDVIKEFPTNEKIIVYCRWSEEINVISSWAEEMGYSYAVLDGSTKDRDRAMVVDRFQHGDAKLLICNIAVGKFSLTLTASATIIYYSMGFSLEEFIQSSDRIHRISQSRTCLYLPLLTENGIDEYIYNSVNRKMKVAQAITDPEFKKILLEVLK